MSDEKKPDLKLVKQEPRIVVSISEPMQDMLAELVKTGLYGTTPADAARRLIERGLENALQEGEPE